MSAGRPAEPLFDLIAAARTYLPLSEMCHFRAGVDERSAHRREIDHPEHGLYLCSTTLSSTSMLGSVSRIRRSQRHPSGEAA